MNKESSSPHKANIKLTSVDENNCMKRMPSLSPLATLWDLEFSCEGPLCTNQFAGDDKCAKTKSGFPKL